MSGEDWIAEYERAVTGLDAEPMADWSEERVRAAASRAWLNEAGERQYRKTLLEAATKVKRALDDKDKKGLPLEQLPKLTPAEIEAVRMDLLRWELVSNMKSVASSVMETGEFFILDLRDWVGMFDVSRSLRGAGRPEWRPGLFAAAFVLCDWFRATRGRAPRSRLYRKDNVADLNDWSARTDGVAYNPSKDLQWLASELVLLDPSLDQKDETGRPLALHQADNFIELWRDARGLKQSRKKNASSGISGTD